MSAILEVILEIIMQVLVEVVFAAIGRFFRWLWQLIKSALASLALIGPELFRRPAAPPPESQPGLMDTPQEESDPKQ